MRWYILPPGKWHGAHVRFSIGWMSRAKSGGASVVATWVACGVGEG
jgi:hypothetical protein